MFFHSLHINKYKKGMFNPEIVYCIPFSFRASLTISIIFYFVVCRVGRKKGTPRSKQNAAHQLPEINVAKLSIKSREGHSIVCDNYNFNYSSRITFICRSNLLPAHGEISKFLFTYSARGNVLCGTLFCQIDK